MRAQLFAALQGGWVAGETLRHNATFFAAAAAPISAEHESRIDGSTSDCARAVDGLAGEGIAPD